MPKSSSVSAGEEHASTHTATVAETKAELPTATSTSSYSVSDTAHSTATNTTVNISSSLESTSTSASASVSTATTLPPPSLTSVEGFLGASTPHNDAIEGVASHSPVRERSSAASSTQQRSSDDPPTVGEIEVKQDTLEGESDAHVPPETVESLKAALLDTTKVLQERENQLALAEMRAAKLHQESEYDPVI